MRAFWLQRDEHSSSSDRAVLPTPAAASGRQDLLLLQSSAHSGASQSKEQVMRISIIQCKMYWFIYMVSYHIAVLQRSVRL